MKSKKEKNGLIRQNQRIINVLNMLSDFILTLCTYFGALGLRFDVLRGKVSLDPTGGKFLLIAAFYRVCLAGVCYILRMYGSYRFKSTGEECLNILLINGMGTLICMAVLFLFRIMDFSRIALVLFWILSSVFVICKRASVRQLLRRYHALGYDHKHVVIVGNGRLTRQYLLDLHRNPHLGYRLCECGGKAGAKSVSGQLRTAGGDSV